MDTDYRDYEFSKYNFLKEYPAEYEAINMQNFQEKELQEQGNNEGEKNHFIRKKVQNANANLKRTCGVSYVKPTESFQKYVDHIWKALPPLIFQCSSKSERL